jgi:hypothetical protein
MAEKTEELTDSQESKDSSKLEDLSDQFSARIEGLRELVEAIAPHVAELDQPERVERLVEQSGLSPEGQQIMTDVYLNDDDPDSPAGTTDKPQREATETGPKPSDESNGSPEQIPPRVQAFVNLVQHQPSAVLRVMRRLNQGYAAPRASLLNGSLLTVAIASFEFLLAGIYKYHLLQHPKQLESDEKEFSLADLMELGSVRDAQRVLAERRADTFMTRRLDEWSAWAKRILGQSFENLSLDAPHLNEMFQRRHIIVHSGGAVDKRYLQRVELSEDMKLDIGDELPVSDIYLYQALDELEVLGHALIAVSRSKWHPNEADQATGQLNLRILDLMQAGRFTLARKLADVGCTLEQSDSDRWIVRVNGWLAMKRLGEFEACRQQVIDWDITALASQFKLARACLLDEVDRAFEYLALTLKSREAMPGQAWDWPILDELRDDPRFPQVFAEVGYSRSEIEIEHPQAS